jgi:hypothetical protein
MATDPAVAMADPDLDLDDEPYDSAEDEDFSLDQAANDDEDAELSSSDEETESAEPAAKRRKTKKDTKVSAALGIEELDSGDEATIRKVKGRKQKQGEKKSSSDEDDVDFDDDEEGGEGGFVRTRAMKMRMYGFLVSFSYAGFCMMADLTISSDRKSENRLRR